MLTPSINTAGIMEYVGGTVLTGAAASMTVSNIPYFPRYIVYFKMRTDDVGQQHVALSFNGDAVAANYTQIGTSGETADQSYIGQVLRSDAAAGRFSLTSGMIEQSDITHMKNFFGIAHTNGVPGSVSCNVRGVLWENVTDAITSITLTPVAGNLVAGCSIRIYGVR